MSTSSRSGFTLVELSIVLVIIGLIVGGVLVGQDLVKQASLRAFASDIDRYRGAVLTFRMKYGALPGDITNAGTIWPSCNVTPANCNGNGDAQINWSAPVEAVKGWQHLSLANLIPADIAYSNTPAPTPGTNVPTLRFSSGVGIHLYWMDSSGSVVNGDRHAFILGKYHATGNTLSGATFSPVDLQNVDSKIDDGKYDTGKFRAATGFGAVGLCDNGTNYDLTITALNCYALSDL